MNKLFILINSLRGRSDVFGNSAFSGNRKGFTLIEQLIVTVTIGILIAVAIPIRDAEASSTVKYKYNGVVRDTSGDPVEDATITVFIANTSSSLDVYESQDSETAVSSVTSDSEGFFEFWLDHPTDDSEYTISDIFNIKVTYTEHYDPVIPDPAPPTSYYVNNISIFPTIQDGSITHEKLSDDAVTSDKIGDDQVRWKHIADKSIQTTHIVGYDNVDSKGNPHQGAVTTPKIRDSAITTDKIANNAVTTGKIANDAVISSKIAAGNLIDEHYSDASIRFRRLALGVVPIILYSNNSGLNIANGGSGISNIQARGAPLGSSTNWNDVGHYWEFLYSIGTNSSHKSAKIKKSSIPTIPSGVTATGNYIRSNGILVDDAIRLMWAYRSDGERRNLYIALNNTNADVRLRSIWSHTTFAPVSAQIP